MKIVVVGKLLLFSAVIRRNHCLNKVIDNRPLRNNTSMLRPWANTHVRRPCPHDPWWFELCNWCGPPCHRPVAVWSWTLDQLTLGLLPVHHPAYFVAVVVFIHPTLGWPARPTYREQMNLSGSLVGVGQTQFVGGTVEPLFASSRVNVSAFSFPIFRLRI